MTTPFLIKDDVGTTIVVHFQERDDLNNLVDVDVSTATIRKVCLLKPDGITILEKNAVFLNSGTDGKIKYDTIAGDLDTAGSWKVAGRIEQVGVYNHRSTERVFTVKESICP